MKTLNQCDLEKVSAAAWLPRVDDTWDVILPKELALGAGLGVLTLFLVPENTYGGKVLATAAGFAVGYCAFPAYQEVTQGFPHFRSK